MAEPRLTHLPYGFAYGPVNVERLWSDDSGRVCIGLETDNGKLLTVHVSPTGRSVRVYRDGVEWKPTNEGSE